MKYKYTGENDCFCIELIAYGIMKKGEYLKKGQILDVPDDNKPLIAALDASGVYKRINVVESKNKEKKIDNGK